MEGLFPSHELKTKIIRTWTGRTFGERACLHNDHRQRVHIGLIRRPRQLFLFGPYNAEEFGGTVAVRAAIGGGRSVN